MPAPEHARLTDDEILEMFESIFGPNNNKKYSDSTLAIWRPRFDVAADKAWDMCVAEYEAISRDNSGQIDRYRMGRGHARQEATEAASGLVDEQVQKWIDAAYTYVQLLHKEFAIEGTELADEILDHLHNLLVIMAGQHTGALLRWDKFAKGE